MMDAPTTDRWIRHLNLLQLVLAGIIIMTPTVWMVLSSFKPSFEVTAYPPTLIFTPTLENYVQLIEDDAVRELRRQQPDRHHRLDGPWTAVRHSRRLCRVMDADFVAGDPDAGGAHGARARCSCCRGT